MLATSGLVSVGYFVSWGIYQRQFNVWNIDPAGLTHINYAFANIANGQVVLGDEYADTQKVNVGHGDSWADPTGTLHGNLYQLFRLKQQARWLKTGISVGGWTWSSEFSDVAATAAGREKFVASAISFVLTYGMDYIDLDWEYPVGGGLPGNSKRPEDGKNLVLLLKEFKRRFAAYPDRNLQITMAISCGVSTLKNYLLAEMDPLIDFYNMMCYDFAGAWSTFTEHQSNLFGRTASADSVTKAVDHALANGASANKLVIGLPLYGRGFTQTSGLTKPFSGVGQGTWEPGIYDYKAIPSMASCRPAWEPVSNASICYNPGERSLVSYDTPTSISFKLQWILQRGLGGVMFWELSADFSLDNVLSLQRMVSIWLGPRLDRTPNQLCFPQSPFSNINRMPGCSTPRRAITSRRFVPDPEYLKSHSPFAKVVNHKALTMARAHYNYTRFKTDTDKLDGTIASPSVLLPRVPLKQLP